MNYAVFIVLVSALVAVGAISIDTYIPSMPAMAVDLDASPGQIQFTMSVFLIGYALSHLVCGPLADRFGRRIVLIWGMGIFVVASIACTMATDIEWLILFRLAQSFGACSGSVVGRAVVRDRYALEDAARAFGYIGMTMMIAPILAPILGAWLGTMFGWRSNFVFMTGFGVIMLLATAAFLAETAPTRDAGAIRPGRIAANYATLMRNPRFMGYTPVIATSFGGVFAFVTGSSFVLIDLLGVGPASYAVLFAITAGGYMAGSFTATRLTPRLGLDRSIFCGVAIYLASAVALNLLAFAGIFTAAAICAPVVAISFGNGLIVPNAQAGAIAPYPHMAGIAAAMMGFMAMAGAGIGGGVVAEFYDGTQLPMTLTLLAGGILAACSLRLLTRPAAAADHG